MTADFQPTAAYDPVSGAQAPGPSSALPQAWISHTVRRLEPWVGWSIAVYTAWLAVFVYPGLPGVWLLCLYAGLVGKWAEVHPARHQAEMALRGVALIAGAYVLHTYAAPESGGPGGDFFFWVSVTCVFYGFLLKPVWGAAVVACAIGEYALAAMHASQPVQSAELVTAAGFLVVFPLLLAMKFGEAMRQPDDTLEEGRIDAATGLYNRAGLLAHGDELLAACRREQRPVSMAVFDCADLAEVRGIYGSRISRRLLERLVRKLSSVAGERGLAARTGPTQFAVMLPGVGRDKALAAVHRAFGNPGRIEFDAGDSEIVLIPELALEVVRGEPCRTEGMLEELSVTLAQTLEREQRRRDYLRRKRERHSRPMGLTRRAPAAS